METEYLQNPYPTHDRSAHKKNERHIDYIAGLLEDTIQFIYHWVWTFAEAVQH